MHMSRFLTSHICLLTLFAKIRFSRKFPNLQYKIASPILIVSMWMEKSLRTQMVGQECILYLFSFVATVSIINLFTI